MRINLFLSGLSLSIMFCNCTGQVHLGDIELISNQIVVAEKSSCFNEIDEGEQLLLKVTDNFDESLFTIGRRSYKRRRALRLGGYG